MAMSVSEREARARFAALADRVRQTGEPVIVEKDGSPIVAMVSVQDVEELERLRVLLRQGEFAQYAAQAARATGEVYASDDEIVSALKSTRSALYQERYGAPNQ